VKFFSPPLSGWLENPLQEVSPPLVGKFACVQGGGGQSVRIDRMWSETSRERLARASCSSPARRLSDTSSVVSELSPGQRPVELVVGQVEGRELLQRAQVDGNLAVEIVSGELQLCRPVVARNRRMIQCTRAPSRRGSDQGLYGPRRAPPLGHWWAARRRLSGDGPGRRSPARPTAVRGA